MSSVRTLRTSISDRAFQAHLARLRWIFAAALVFAGVVVPPPAAAQPPAAAPTCAAVTGSNTQQSPKSGPCPCTQAEYDPLENRAVLGINAQPPVCAAGCAPAGAAQDTVARSCRTLEPKSSVCIVKLTRTQPCAPETGVDDPLFVTLAMVLLASLMLLYRFRRRAEA
jgi:LPXTG-motif cell wall-anchored protein